MLSKVTFVVVAICACAAQAHADGVLELTVPADITIECDDPSNTGEATCNTTCGGEGVVWSQDHQIPPGAHGANWNTQNIADDITFDDDQSITSIRWWGGTYNGDPVALFRVRFYDHLGGPNYLLDPDSVVYEEDVTPTSTLTGESLPGTPAPAEYVFEAALPGGFTATAGTTYWIEVVGYNFGTHGTFGWSTSTTPPAEDGNNDAAFRTSPTNPWQTGLADRAFELTGTAGTGTCRVSFNDETVSGCGDTETITCTWTATDDCGNESTGDQTITVVDTTAPVLSGCPEDMTVACGAVPSPATVTATDNCDPAPTVSFSENVAPTTCPADPIREVITRTWAATDACDNASTCVQTITVLKVVLDLDIKPGSCPNSYNRNSHGVLPVGLLGTADFDVATVDVSTVLISRADCVGGSVAPNSGPPGPRTRIEDVGTPFAGDPCNCHELEGDGIDDLSMKFKTDLVVADLGLNALSPGALVELVVTGGCQFIASDCVRLVPPGTGAVVMSVEANCPETWAGVSPLDLTLDGGGFTDFERSFPEGTLVTLTAEPSTADGRPFIAWLVDGVTHAGETTIDVTLLDPSTARAVYQSP